MQRGFWAFLIVTNIGVLSPTAVAAAMPIMQTLLNLPPEHFSDLSWHVLPHFCRIVHRLVSVIDALQVVFGQ